MKTFLISLFLLWTAFCASSQTVNIALTQAPCNANGILTATVTGLTPPLTFTWNATGSPTVVHSGVMSLSDNLTSYTGAYVTVAVTGAGPGNAYDYFSGAPPFTYSTATLAPAQCPNLGSLNTTVVGGTPPYTFQYIDKLTNLVASTSNPASLPAGFYEVMITDNAGCVFGSIYTNDSIQVGQINTFTISHTQTPAACTNGVISITNVAGGVAPYTYLWSNGATTATISNLIMGYYYVAVTDNANCTEVASYYLPQSVNINPACTPTPATCLANDGSVVCNPIGGTPPYTYQWYNGATTQLVSNLPGGYYGLQVSDANGCIGTGGGNVGISSPVYTSATSTSSLCTAATGTATATITGGTPPYTVNWFTFPAQVGLTATNLAPGNYSYKVTDNVGCIKMGYVTVNPVSILNITLATTPATCLASDGNAYSTISGGTPPYTYLWNTGDVTASILNKPAGAYSVVITDNMSCSKYASKDINVTTPVNIALSSNSASCLLAADGSISATALGGTAPYTWLGGINAYNNVTHGTYYFAVTDANGCTANKYGSVAYNAANTSCYCTITGFVYEDLNNNCIKDPGEVGLKNILMHCSGIGYSLTNANGSYSFIVPTGTYTLTETIQPYYPLAACQNNGIVVNAVAAQGCVQNVDFGNTIIPLHDVKINTWDFQHPVPGFTHIQKLVITNMGNVTEPNILTGYKSEPLLNTPWMVPAIPLVNAGINWYNNVGTPISLAPSISKTISINYNTPANIPLATLITCNDTTAYAPPIANWLTDNTPWDNVHYFLTNVVGPYDPNFKEVSPKGSGANGGIYAKDSVLDYMVHFQNLGSYFAQNVVVLDTLDADLDWTTLKAVYNTHPCKVSISETGEARFEFKNINLPAKADNEAGSQGMFSYTIRAKKNLAIGTQFTNSASIYFDFNAPVQTNTTVNTLLAPNGVANLESANNLLKLYPNPTTSILNIEVESLNNMDKGSIKVLDITGKEIYNTNITAAKGKNLIQINTSAFPAGMYFVTLKTSTDRYTAKFMKVD